MIATNPIQINGKTYDRFALNLIVSGTYATDGQPEVSVVCNLTPLCISDGVVETAPDAAMLNIRLGSLSQADTETLSAITAIQTALQAYLTSKGI